MFRSFFINALLASIIYAQDCTLKVPANPLTAAGMTTPYQVSGCSQRADASSFVECAIYDNAGNIEIYAPLVIDAGDKVNVDFVPPVPVNVPNGATVGCWFGTNGDSLTLTGPGAAGCTNGLGGSIFGQFAFCSGQTFMAVGQFNKLSLSNILTGH
jgi:hypothetical protein